MVAVAITVYSRIATMQLSGAVEVAIAGLLLSTLGSVAAVATVLVLHHGLF
jgi:hypothetical protein